MSPDYAKSNLVFFFGTIQLDLMDSCLNFFTARLLLLLVDFTLCLIFLPTGYHCWFRSCYIRQKLDYHTIFKGCDYLYKKVVVV